MMDKTVQMRLCRVVKTAMWRMESCGGMQCHFKIGSQCILKTTHMMYTNRFNSDVDRLREMGFNINRIMEDCSAAISHNSVIMLASIV